MSTLDDLRASARAAKDASQAQDEAAKRATERFTQSIGGGMRYCFGGFKELAENLNLLEQAIRRDLHVEGFGDVVGIKQTNYRVIADPEREQDEFRLACDLTLPKPVKIVKHSKASMQHQKAVLDKAGFDYDLAVEKNDPVNPTTAFRLKPRVLASAGLKVRRDALKVDLVLRNLGKLGERSVELQPHELDEALLEEIANLLLTRPNRFQVDEKLNISDDVRAKLQARLREESRGGPGKDRKRDDKKAPGASEKDEKDKGRRGGLFSGLLKR